MQSIYFYVMIGSVFLFVFFIVLFSGLPKVVRVKNKKAINKLSYYEMPYSKGEKKIPSFFERMILPVLGKIAGLTKRLSSSNITENTKEN